MVTVQARAARIRAALTPSEWSRVGGMAGTVAGLHVLGWGMLAAALSGHYHISKTEIFGLGTGFLAYTLGMRHAFDADHIAGIDNPARKVDAPWRMYPIGVLFGLGFDTATEVALLVLAGTAVVGGLPFYAILSMPILFAAGMSLFDTADGCFMNFAYDWAFARPARKIFYNLTITGLSVFVAVFVGAIELLGLLAQNAHLDGSFWSFLAGFNINTAGFVIVGVFVVTWIVALCIWHFGRIEQKWESGPAITPD